MDIPKNIREKVLERDSYDGCPCCVYCGKPLRVGGHLHHVVFRSQGGKNEVNNLVTLCFNCHMKIHSEDKDIKEFVKKYLEGCKK